MMQHMRQYIPRDFTLTEYELVDSRYTESGSALQDSAQTLDTMYPGYREIAFYVRPLPRRPREPRQPRLSIGNMLRFIRLQRNGVHSRVHSGVHNGHCMICQDVARVTAHYGCTHTFCEECIQGCEQADIHRCAVCRHRRTRENVETLIMPQLL